MSYRAEATVKGLALPLDELIGTIQQRMESAVRTSRQKPPNRCSGVDPLVNRPPTRQRVIGHRPMARALHLIRHNIAFLSKIQSR